MPVKITDNFTRFPPTPYKGPEKLAMTVRVGVMWGDGQEMAKD